MAARRECNCRTDPRGGGGTDGKILARIIHEDLLRNDRTTCGCVSSDDLRCSHGETPCSARNRRKSLPQAARSLLATAFMNNAG